MHHVHWQTIMGVATGDVGAVKSPLAQGVCKQWNELLEWWNTGMEVYYEFLHLNIPQLAYLHILSILHLIIDQT